MKNKIVSLAVTTFTVMTLIGCQDSSEEKMSTATNSASDLPAPAGMTSNSPALPPDLNGNDTNSSAALNPPATNTPTTGAITN